MAGAVTVVHGIRQFLEYLILPCGIRAQPLQTVGNHSMDHEPVVTGVPTNTLHNAKGHVLTNRNVVTFSV